MQNQPGSTKRPICPSCSKPTRTCICTRFKASKIDNSVAITILQHSLEKNHPLNSTRIALLGLNNLQIVSVFDVNFQAKFSIRVLDPDTEMGSRYIEERNDFCEKDCNFIGFNKYPEMGSSYIGERNDFCENDASCRGYKKYCNEVTEGTIDLDGKLSLSEDFEGEKMGDELLVSAHLFDERSGSCTLEVQECVENGEAFLEGTTSRSYEEASIDFSIEKYGVISSFGHCWMAKGELKEPMFEKLLECKEAVDDLARGFVVKKLQRKQINGILLDDKSEEFEIIIPQGSVLLFPSEKAVGIGELQCEVKNLIVLDGTWAKARRMYNENPWLKVLPHLKLDIDTMSLYNEVRQQPKAGYLSTIESIVYSLKAIGNDCEGLDGLLDVFESMVGDQRRFKNERMNEELT
ncbi:hypothetical protein Leryth_013582 [Lithospermum erythrorhizon]|nr:hypothetical protein Leryth_013582 [Lithospermum erythrorhizon]